MLTPASTCQASQTPGRHSSFQLMVLLTQTHRSSDPDLAASAEKGKAERRPSAMLASSTPMGEVFRSPYHYRAVVWLFTVDFLQTSVSRPEAGNTGFLLGASQIEDGSGPETSLCGDKGSQSATCIAAKCAWSSRRTCAESRRAAQ